jgi:hypothetical protein
MAEESEVALFPYGMKKLLNGRSMYNETKI